MLEIGALHDPLASAAVSKGRHHRLLNINALSCREHTANAGKRNGEGEDG